MLGLSLIQQSVCSGAVAQRAPRDRLLVKAQATSGAAAPFKLPKAPLPKDAEGVKAAIAKSHEMHGQGRSMWFCLTGAGKRATADTYLAHADTLDWNTLSSGSIDSYNIFS